MPCQTQYSWSVSSAFQPTVPKSSKCRQHPTCPVKHRKDGLLGEECLVAKCTGDFSVGKILLV